MRVVRGIALSVAALVWSAPEAPAQYVVGDFTFEFVDPTTGNQITTLNIPAVNSTAKVAVYLLQTGHTSSPLAKNFGAESLGVRINYPGSGSSTGTPLITVPNATQVNMAIRPAGTIAQNQGYSSDFDFVFRYGTGQTGGAGQPAADLTSSAAITEALFTNVVLPFPNNGGSGEFEAPPSLAMLIGTFTLKGLAGGTQTVQAVSAFPGSGSNTSGPNPQIIGTYPDSTTGPTFGNGVTSGEINIDNLLSATIPTLTVTVVPEPSSMALGTLAIAGFAAWRRRRMATPVAA
jgi:MYXO-CTERM domain-containing protein